MATPVSCFHCGLPVLTGNAYTAVVLKEERIFCCPGCQAVAQTIIAGGLESYYQHRSEPSANPEALPGVLPDELLLLDREDIQKPFVSTSDNISQTRLLIEGITCAACGWLIEKHLKQLPGVLEATLNLSNHRLFISWDAEQVALSDLMKTIRHIGYAAHPWQPDKISEQMQADNRRALRKLGVAGLLWMQVMMASMATWPEFNLDLSAGMDGLLRWTS